ncbi:MAG: GNAT family N-acetyltransferase [Verrucomicrobia bacterium]|nr:GNAT family N-acetyltransferase [Verrucomicrobiota bacterium]
MKLQVLSTAQVTEIVELLAYLNPAVSRDILRKRYEKIVADHSNYQIIGAFVEDRLVGLSGVWRGTKIWCGDFMEVDNLVVHPDFRGRGVATGLMKQIEVMAKEENCNIIVLDSYTNNHSSHRLYHRQGCEIWGFHFVKPMRRFEH